MPDNILPMPKTLDSPPPSVKSLVAKLAEVVTLVGRVEKRGRNEFHEYDYATAADVLEAVRGHLAERRVVIVPRITGVDVIEKARDGKAPLFITTVSVTYAIIDGDSDAVLEMPWRGCGEDAGDKGLYKALTGGYKYLLFQLFMIPTGDDPERDNRKRGHARAVDTPVDPDSDAGIILTVAAAIGLIDGRHPDDIIKQASGFTDKNGKIVPGFTDPRSKRPGKWLAMTREKLERELHAKRAQEPGAAEAAKLFE